MGCPETLSTNNLSAAIRTIVFFFYSRENLIKFGPPGTAKVSRILEILPPIYLFFYLIYHYLLLYVIPC